MSRIARKKCPFQVSNFGKANNINEVSSTESGKLGVANI